MAHNILSGAVISPLQLAPPPDGTVHVLSGNLSTSDGASILNVPRVSNATNNALITNVGGDANTLVCESNLTFDGSTLAITGDLTASINISASAFYGDGSGLTGVDSVSGSTRHYSATGLETSGYLKVSGSTTLGSTTYASAIENTNYSGSGTLTSVGTTTLVGPTLLSSSLTSIANISSSAGLTAVAGITTPGALKVSGSSILGALSSSGTIQAVGAAILGSTLTVSGALTGSKGKFDLSTGNIIFSGSIIGDGSGLTGIDSVSGSSRHYSTTGFETSGYLKVSGSSTLAAVSGSGILHAVGASTFGSTVASSGSVTSVGLYSTDLISGSLGLHIDAPATFGGIVSITGSVSGSGTLGVVGSISSSANVAVTGAVHATTYYGDGSNLTGIGGASISGSARHYSATGLETSGYLKVSGSTTLAGALSSSNVIYSVGSISSSGDIAITGAMHATAYYGDGSNLTGIAAGSVSGSDRVYSSTGLETSGYLKVTGSTVMAGNMEITGHIVPGTANTYDLGSAAKPWRNLYVSSSTIYLGTDTLKVENDNLKFGSGSTDKGFDVGFMNFVNNGIFMEQGRLFKLRAYQIQLFGGVGYVRNVVADDYTIKDVDYLIGIQSNTLSNSITLTLPGADSLLNGQTFIVKDEGGAIDTYPVTVSCAVGDLIDGQNKVVLTSPYASIQIYCNGNNKFFIC